MRSSATPLGRERNTLPVIKGTDMPAWQILPVPADSRFGYAWRWKREDVQGHTECVSEKEFAYYYDCVMDAKKHGFNPDAPRRIR
jgi:hypothetical protein